MLAGEAALVGADADASTRWTAPELPHDRLSVLYGAAGRNHDAALTRRLLQVGADPDDNESLYRATEAADDTIVRLLLEAGARVTDRNALFRARPCAPGHGAPAARPWR